MNQKRAISIKFSPAVLLCENTRSIAKHGVKFQLIEVEELDACGSLALPNAVTYYAITVFLQKGKRRSRGLSDIYVNYFLQKSIAFLSFYHTM